MCGALRYIGREDGGYIICMCVCVYVFFLLGVCDIYVFTIHVTYVCISGFELHSKSQNDHT